MIVAEGKYKTTLVNSELYIADIIRLEGLSTALIKLAHLLKYSWLSPEQVYLPKAKHTKTVNSTPQSYLNQTTENWDQRLGKVGKYRTRADRAGINHFVSIAIHIYFVHR